MTDEPGGVAQYYDAMGDRMKSGCIFCADPELGKVGIDITCETCRERYAKQIVALLEVPHAR